MNLVNHLTDRLLFAVPKKGRLQQPTLDLLSGSDIQFRREHRLDIALVKNLPIALIFLPAADIPTFVGEGRVDLGITGRDQVAEYDAKLQLGEISGVREIMDLGFGKCSLQVQVPERSMNGSPTINDVRELLGKHIVTSFSSLTEDYFAHLEGRGGRKEIVNGTDSPIPNLRTKVKFVGGSVEAACALGVADGIVDLVESGETMRAAGLKAIGTVLESTAVLIRSKNVSNENLVNLITARIRGVITAQKYILCQYNVERQNLSAATRITPGKRAPTITALEEANWVAVSSMVERKDTATVMDQLTAVGAADVLILDIINTRTA